jgi:hypothetical protein
MKFSRSDIKKFIYAVLNEGPQQSPYDLRREVRDKFINDHLMRHFKDIYPDKSINGPDDIRIARFSDDERHRGYSTTSSWGDYEWNDRALRHGKGIGRDDFPVIWFSIADFKFGPGGLDSIIKTMNAGTMEGSGYVLTLTRTRPNDPFSDYHGAADKAVAVVYMKKI